MSVPAVAQQNVYSTMQTKLDAMTIKINVIDSSIRKYQSSHSRAGSELFDIKKLFGEAKETLRSLETFALQNCIEANSWDITAIVIKFEGFVRDQPTFGICSDGLSHIAERISKLRAYMSEKAEKSEPKEVEVVALREEVKKQGATIEQLKQDIQLLRMALLAQGESGSNKRPRSSGPNDS